MSEARVPSDPARDARVQAWNATQWLARLANSFAQHPEPGLPLKWDVAATRIVTPDLVPGIAVGLTLPTLVLQFDRDGELDPHPLALDDRSSSEVEAWILVELLHRHLERERFSKALPYATPKLMSGEEAKYTAQTLAVALGQLVASLAEASDTLQRAAGLLGDATTTLVVWPERMEIGFAVPAFEGDSADRSIRIAYASGTADEPSPCFRVVRDGSQASILQPDSATDTPKQLAERVAAARAAAVDERDS